MLGDTVIAVHPQDPRYTHMVGKYALHPFCQRKLLIVADDYVDKDFGTGKRHNLATLTIFSDDGQIIGDCGQFTGLKRFEARLSLYQRFSTLQCVEVEDGEDQPLDLSAKNLNLKSRPKLL
uniref:valine--tRNA ligase n=1 Tax=Daphnia galeata TaxID=27404 RepID=A0A8J2S2X4_9CRUS|nr:unnamed protein product [Daphnia galeata]